MKRKLLAMLLAASLVVGAFAGCSGSGGSSSSQADTSTSSTTDQSEAADDQSDASEDQAETSDTSEKNLPEVTSEDLTLVLWDGSTEDPDKSRMEDAVARFMEAYPNITVEEIHQQNDTYKQQLIVAMSSGQCPDMYIHWGGGPMAEYPECRLVVTKETLTVEGMIKIVYDLLKDKLNIAKITFTSGVNAASAEFTTHNKIDRCPLCGIALNENGVCPKCGYKKG